MYLGKYKVTNLLGVKWIKAPVAEELPPRFSPFACQGRDRRLRFSMMSSSDALPLGVKWKKAEEAEEL
ncbi:MAG: hypothetical protein ABS934_04240, partial [Psychrobacillus sp.]